MRILITGSRRWDDRITLARALEDAARGAGDVTVIHGDCPTGADKMADREARARSFEVEQHPADWEWYGKPAGHIRNQEMVDSGADICLAFYQPGAENKGTDDCVARARRAGIPVVIYGGEI